MVVQVAQRYNFEGCQGPDVFDGPDNFDGPELEDTINRNNHQRQQHKQQVPVLKCEALNCRITRQQTSFVNWVRQQTPDAVNEADADNTTVMEKEGDDVEEETK